MNVDAFKDTLENIDTKEELNNKRFDNTFNDLHRKSYDYKDSYGRDVELGIVYPEKWDHQKKSIFYQIGPSRVELTCYSDGTFSSKEIVENDNTENDDVNIYENIDSDQVENILKIISELMLKSDQYWKEELSARNKLEELKEKNPDQWLKDQLE